MAVAAQLGGNLLVGGPIGGGGAEDESAAEDEGLRGRACADERLKLLMQLVGETKRGSEGTWHERPPCNASDRGKVQRLIV
jgi:hypothetical protein